MAVAYPGAKPRETPSRPGGARSGRVSLFATQRGHLLDRGQSLCVLAPSGLRPAVFFPRSSGTREGIRQKEAGMSSHDPTGTNWAEALQQFEARRRARVVASFAEYLAEDVRGNAGRALEAMASLAEWCDGDPEVLAQARADALRDTHRATLKAQTIVAQNNRDAVELLELVARAS